MKLIQVIEQINQKQIILVSGKIASGKGYFISKKYPKYNVIVVSDIVKQLVGSSNRSKLTNTQSLDKQISDSLISKIKPLDKVVVDGIRQLSIIKAIVNKFGEQSVNLIWLDVPNSILKQRFDNRDDAKDDLTFNQALKKDEQLGLNQVEQYIRANGIVINN